MRRVPLPAALFADAVAWLKSEAALGLGSGFAPARLVTLLDALRPFLGVANANGAAGTWALAPGLTLRADADASGSARLGLALDTSAFELPVGAGGRLVVGGAFALVLAPGAAARAGVEVWVGLPSASTGRSAVHVVFADQLRVFLRPAVGADVALFPNPAGLGQLAASAVTQALPLVLDALADLAPQGGVEGDVGTLVVRIGDALALRSAGHFEAAALQAWAADPAAALAARLPTLVAAALDQVAQAIAPLLPAAASATFSAGELRVVVGAFTLGITPSPLAVRVVGDLAALPAIDHAHLALTLDAGGLASFELGVGPASIDAGGVLLKPAFDVVAGNAPVGGARARLALGLPGDRLVGARWKIGEQPLRSRPRRRRRREHGARPGRARPARGGARPRRVVRAAHDRGHAAARQAGRRSDDRAGAEGRGARRRARAAGADRPAVRRRPAARAPAAPRDQRRRRQPEHHDRRRTDDRPRRNAARRRRAVDRRAHHAAEAGRDRPRRRHALARGRRALDPSAAAARRCPTASSSTCCAPARARATSRSHPGCP